MTSPGFPFPEPKNLPTTLRDSSARPGNGTGSEKESAPTLGPSADEESLAPGIAGRSFSEYKLLKELGRGGMGVVYKAVQLKLDRLVALKMILPGPLANLEDLQRFRNEVEATARLQHINIVKVFEVGENEGQHFYSMEFIDGPSLAQRLAEGPLPGLTAARYVMLIARAMHHAHQQGILHRDLKPSNILLDGDDQPHITDFGLAKRLGGDSGQTQSGTILGTPSYMAPEQAAGKVRELGPACDVYSMGAMLYELITGRPPFRAATPIDTIMQVLEQDPAPPRLLNHKIDPDLETICIKCLEKQAELRYSSAEALAEDLQCYLSGDSISARSFNMLARLTRTLGRSQNDIEFRSWGTLLLIFGVIVFIGHLFTFLLVESALPVPLHWVARFSQFGAMGLVFWHYRKGRSVLATSAAERQLWSIWLGYLVAFLISVMVSSELVDHLGNPGWTQSARRWGELALYPFSAILTGLAFFAMGSNYWGRCYAIGLGFFALAVVMPSNLDLAPLEFGVAWSLAFVTIGIHVRKLG